MADNRYLEAIKRLLNVETYFSCARGSKTRTTARRKAQATVK